MTGLAHYSEDIEPPPLRGAARAAVLLLALGAEGAAKLLKHMSPEEIITLREAASALSHVLPEQIDEVVEDFSTTFRKGPIFPGPAQQMTDLLRSALTENEFTALFPNEKQMNIDRILYQDTRNVWEAVAEIDGSLLAEKIAGEHPQVIAILLSKLPSEVAVVIVQAFEPALRNDVMRRMLTVKALAPQVQTLFETHVREAYLVSGSSEDGSGKHAVVAEVINRLDKAAGEEIMEIIGADLPEDAAALKKMLFAFEDVPTMPVRARLTLFDGINADTVIMALRGASEEIKEAVLSSQGARARRMIEAELSQEASPNKADIDAARRLIAGRALELAGAGTIQLREEAGEA